MFLWAAARKWWTVSDSELVIDKAVFDTLNDTYHSPVPAHQATFCRTMEALYNQAQTNFELFMHNISALESYHPLHTNIATSYLVPKLLALSLQEPLKYNACIKRLITNGVVNGPLSIPFKKQWLLNAIDAKNKELVVWFFEEGGLSLEDPIVRHYPLIIYLANDLQSDKLAFLFNLKMSNHEPLVKPSDLNYQSSPEHFDHSILHTPLERAITIGWGSPRIDDNNTLVTARLLRQQGATNFGTLSLAIKEAFLQWETHYIPKMGSEPSITLEPTKETLTQSGEHVIEIPAKLHI